MFVEEEPTRHSSYRSETMRHRSNIGYEKKTQKIGVKEIKITKDKDTTATMTNDTSNGNQTKPAMLRGG